MGKGIVKRTKDVTSMNAILKERKPRGEGGKNEIARKLRQGPGHRKRGKRRGKDRKGSKKAIGKESLIMKGTKVIEPWRPTKEKTIGREGGIGNHEGNN